MKKRYTLSLALIVLLLTITLSISTSYGLWKVTSNNNLVSVDENGCFDIIYNYNDSGILEISKINPLNQENGKATSPYTFSIKNKCDTTKTAEIRLNVLESNTMELKGLTLFMAGEVDLQPSKYADLKNSRSKMEQIDSSKILNTVTIPANSTLRTNLKIWFDEKQVSSIDQNQILRLIIEITDKESIVIPTFKETILEQHGGSNAITSKGVPNFNDIAVNNEGLYTTLDDDGISYYYRGNVTNNYVSFAGLTWRIVRINGDETVRLISQDSLLESTFNSYRYGRDYTGYTYDRSTEEMSSTIKETLDAWYRDNIENTKYNNYIAATRYCADSSSYTTNSYYYKFNSNDRLFETQVPSLICNNTEEDFGGTYKLKVGLISADEVVFAGSKYNTSNTSFYLYNNSSFYTMTPSSYRNYSAYTMFINENGSLLDSQVSYKKMIRPVISLKATTVVVGDGTINNPYRIDEDAN